MVDLFRYTLYYVADPDWDSTDPDSTLKQQGQIVHGRELIDKQWKRQKYNQTNVKRRTDRKKDISNITHKSFFNLTRRHLSVCELQTLNASIIN